jgi:hypothetical protein
MACRGLDRRMHWCPCGQLGYIEVKPTTSVGTSPPGKNILNGRRCLDPKFLAAPNSNHLELQNGLASPTCSGETERGQIAYGREQTGHIDRLVVIPFCPQFDGAGNLRISSGDRAWRWVAVESGGGWSGWLSRRPVD